MEELEKRLLLSAYLDQNERVIAEVATIARTALAHIEALTARADEAEAMCEWLATRLAEYAGCPGQNDEACPFPGECGGAGGASDNAVCWEAVAAQEKNKKQ